MSNNSENKKLVKCWLDCDPGHDDACAILLASFCKRIEIIGISTVSGNQTIEKTSKNALNVLNLLGLISESDAEKSLPWPLITGSARPLLRPSVICDEIHGESGLETHSSIEFPKIPQHAYDHFERINSAKCHFTTSIYEHLKREAEPVTLIATGPLTNVANLIINYRDVNKYIEKIVLMGGAAGVGNTGPVAEFNIQVDPEAAHIVFEADIPIYMVPLEVTHTALVTPDILESIQSINSNFSKILIELLLFFKTTYLDVFKMNDPPLHDPCAVAFVIDPSLFEYRLMRVDIETSSSLSYGQTVCDVYGMSKKKKNAYVCFKMDVPKFWELMINAIKNADSASRIN